MSNRVRLKRTHPERISAEQLRDWRRLSEQDQVLVVMLHGIEAVPASERHRFKVRDLDPDTGEILDGDAGGVPGA